MTHLYHDNDQYFVTDLIDNPIIPLANTVLILPAGKFLDTMRAGIGGEIVDRGFKDCFDVRCESV